MVDRCNGWAVTEMAGIMNFNDPTSCLPSPSPTAAAKPLLPKSGEPVTIADSLLILGLVGLLLLGPAIIALRRRSRARR
jgi:hypothetical protein